MRSSPHPARPPKPRLRETLRELAAGVDSRGIGRLFQQEAPDALRQLVGERTPESLGRSRLRRLYFDARDVFLGLSRRLSPPRRALFVLSLFTTMLGVFDIELSMGERILIDSSPLWFLTAVASLVLLLSLELVDRLRVRDEIEVARVLQRDLLPQQVDAPPGWRIAHHYRTAAEIGGDYYDFHGLDDGRFAFAIGDASGHGIGAGLLMTITSVSLGAALETNPSPEAVLDSVNRILCRTGGSRAFLTLFYAVLDPQKGTLEWSNAGHPYPLLRRVNGEVLELGRGSLPLGLRRKGSWESQKTELNPGDLLVLFSDGFPEARGKGGDFGFERLRYEVQSSGSPEYLHAKLWHCLESHLGEEPLRDDATLVILGRDPLSPAHLPSLPPVPPPPLPKADRPAPPVPPLPPLPQGSD